MANSVDPDTLQAVSSGSSLCAKLSVLVYRDKRIKCRPCQPPCQQIYIHVYKSDIGQYKWAELRNLNGYQIPAADSGGFLSWVRYNHITVLTLRIRTDRPEQTVRTYIRRMR